MITQPKLSGKPGQAPLDVVSGGEVSTLEFPGGVLECANAG